MRFVLAIVMGLIAFAPAASRAAAACVGKVQFVYVEEDTNVYFNIQPTGECGCNNIALSGSRGFKATTVNKKEQYAALMTANVSKSDVQIWYDWSGASGSSRCYSYNAALIG